jgi:hypothetical protein
MKLTRLVLTIAVAFLTVGGYLASTYASLAGDPRTYADRIDQPSIAMLALVLLIACIMLAFIPDRSEE